MLQHHNHDTEVASLQLFSVFFFTSDNQFKQRKKEIRFSVSPRVFEPVNDLRSCLLLIMALSISQSVICVYLRIRVTVSLLEETFFMEGEYIKRFILKRCLIQNKW